ncbi:TIR domain-containing protein [Gemmatimonas sp.]|uniref:TIR domain-containing protein n=1 Tax=Gemmatimonas sp. TaxID=1962908 RepID=UPI0035619723
MKGDVGTLNSRARQNVVLELGMFMGRLGPPRVSVVYEPGVEFPSDISGVLYTELDPADAWRNALAARDPDRWPAD